ncbi:MAG: hypothetical protein PHT38_01055 [Halothiobacillus sp.]|jgi:hypothetical protein|nr:hypothetical protein [Halothiobacillus sp.]
MDKVKIMRDEEIAEFCSAQREIQDRLLKEGNFIDLMKAIDYRNSTLAANLAATKPGIIGVEARNSASRLWVAILPETGGKIVRIQFWGKNGFNAHACYNTAEQALREIVRQGFIYPDPGSLGRMAATKAFIDGNRLIEEMHRRLAGDAA